MLSKGLPALAMAALLVGAVPIQAQQMSRPPQRPATQQQPSQQTLRLQQQMTRMQQHMQQLRGRIQVVDQDLARSMDRMKARDQARDQGRLREHQALREMCTDLGAMTRQMEQSANRLQQNVQNRLFQEDDQLRREADRLRERYRDMAHEMELSVQALERMQKRLGQVAADGS
ncbi:MAG TPA: hypothetical protein VLA33_02890 [Gemmatimonadota bacterium]|nr:hypothetical protein [Gemmatimonadota bacterium]